MAIDCGGVGRRAAEGGTGCTSRTQDGFFVFFETCVVGNAVRLEIPPAATVFETPHEYVGGGS
jgi:hypothetical protein